MGGRRYTHCKKTTRRQIEKVTTMNKETPASASGNKEVIHQSTYQGDCLDVLKTLPDDHFDSIVTDPPAGIGFMNQAWDSNKGEKANWIKWFNEVSIELLRVLKPGAFALVWALPRTAHWTTEALEEAGFQIRDKIYHVFGSGFPKSLDVSKAIDQHLKAERKVVGTNTKWRSSSGDSALPTTEEARHYEGFGTALKPAVEEWILGRKKPEGSIAQNVLKHGTGALNIDASRIKDKPNNSNKVYDTAMGGGYWENTKGKYPAHLIHDGSEEVVVNIFPCTSTAEFFYCAKASVEDKNEGLQGLPQKTTTDGREKTIDNPYLRGNTNRFNHHPTVKSSEPMKYLCRLITPAKGLVLDPFMGSGSTGKAALLEDFTFVGIEKEDDYFQLAKARLIHAQRQLSFF